MWFVIFWFFEFCNIFLSQFESEMFFFNIFLVTQVLFTIWVVKKKNHHKLWFWTKKYSQNKKILITKICCFKINFVSKKFWYFFFISTYNLFGHYCHYSHYYHCSQYCHCYYCHYLHFCHYSHYYHYITYYHYLVLLNSCKGHFFTNVSDKATDQQTDCQLNF